MFRFELAVILLEALIFVTCRVREGYFDKQKGYHLANSVIATLTVDSDIDCVLKCTANSLCKSVNYRHGNSDVKLCNLNNKTRRSAQAEDFISNPEFTYIEKDPCALNPCWFGFCSKSSVNDGFVCTCKPGYKDSLCKTERIGWFSHKPGKSCKDIKSNGDAVHDGKYWIDPENSGNAFQVYCDMNQEGGGWLLVSNVILPSTALIPSLSLSTSYRDIANYNGNATILSTATLGKIRQLTSFTQLRFHCRLAKIGRTLHIITTANSKGYYVVDYFAGVHNIPPPACDSFYRGSADTSLLAGKCSLWKDGGKWSSSSRSTLESKLHDHTFYVPNLYHWITKSSSVQCDSRITLSSDRSPGDYWRIYVR